VLGEDPESGGASWRSRIGVVLQESEPERDLTVSECLRLFAGYFPASRDLAETLSLVGLAERADATASRLAGGQRRRLDVAMALIGDPELVRRRSPTLGRFDSCAAPSDQRPRATRRPRPSRQDRLARRGLEAGRGASGAGPRALGRYRLPVVDRRSLKQASLPGGELVEKGLSDLAKGMETVESLLVSIGSPRLRRLGFDVASPVADAEERLYLLLARDDPDGAHSRYNALVRRLVSFERAAESAR
jgi:hypothetical protein